MDIDTTEMIQIINDLCTEYNIQVRFEIEPEREHILTPLADQQDGGGSGGPISANDVIANLNETDRNNLKSRIRNVIQKHKKTNIKDIIPKSGLRTEIDEVIRNFLQELDYTVM